MSRPARQNPTTVTEAVKLYYPRLRPVARSLRIFWVVLVLLAGLGALVGAAYGTHALWHLVFPHFTVSTAERASHTAEDRAALPLLKVFVWFVNLLTWGAGAALAFIPTGCVMEALLEDVPTPTSILERRALRRADHEFGWRPREGARHPADREDTWDRHLPTIGVGGTSVCFQIERWKYDKSWRSWTRSADRIPVNAPEPETPDQPAARRSEVVAFTRGPESETKVQRIVRQWRERQPEPAPRQELIYVLNVDPDDANALGLARAQIMERCDALNADAEQAFWQARVDRSARELEAADKARAHGQREQEARERMQEARAMAARLNTEVRFDQKEN